MATERRHDCAFLETLPLDGRVSHAEEDRERVATDESPHPAHLPDAVVWPQSTADVQAVVAAANERGVPVTPRSGGSSVEGNPIPVEGGVVLNVIEMDAVEVRPADLQAVVGPGIGYDALNDRLAAHDLRFAPGIAAGHLATIGGMLANNASGLNAVRYGVTRDHIRRLEVVLPDGRVIQCGRDVAKTAAGYSLKDLFVGSEGTLGVVTEATLSLEAIPRARRAALVTFPTRVAASRAVTEIMGAGLVPGALEYIDTEATRMMNAATDIRLDEAPTLIVELHGNESGVAEDLDAAVAHCEAAGATGWEVAEDEAAIDDVWLARREAYPAARDYRNGWDVAVIGDVVVPVSRYPDIVRRTIEVSEELDVPCPCVGHAGDGNLHFLPLADPDDDESVDRAMALNDRLVAAAVEMGGTATGEHGIGIGKREFMRDEHAEAVDLMREIKQLVDENGIMNPGKVLPDE